MHQRASVRSVLAIAILSVC